LPQGKARWEQNVYSRICDPNGHTRVLDWIEWVLV
jgi:hypothetical protein